MAILNNNPLIGSGGQQGYSINNSLRFRGSATAYLSRTPASAGNRKTWTWSAWIKLGTISVNMGTLLGVQGQTAIYLNDGTTSSFRVNGAAGSDLITSLMPRDPSAWYHLVVACDTTQATDTNRLKIYVNGVQQTAFQAGATYPTLNGDTYFNSTSAHYIGRRVWNGDQQYDGYIAEQYLIDGSQKAASDFGETDTTTGVWKPKAYSGTYGTNGFYLKFSDIATTSGSNAGLGKDFSGNSNYWTTNNISVTSGTTYDAMTDSPTNTSATVANYCVLSPISGSTNSVSNANLTTSNAGTYRIYGTFGLSSNKWYWEYTVSSIGSGVVIGISNNPSQAASDTNRQGYYSVDGRIYNDAGNTAYGNTYTTNDIIGIALDMDNGKLFFSKNGTWQNSGDPATGTNPAVSSLTGTYYPFATTVSCTINANFGQRPFTYTPPTGFNRLNTYNLPDSTIKKGNSYMDATLWTGDGTSSRSITNAALFRPDFVWIKQRSGAEQHQAFDSIRGATKVLNPNLTNAESTDVTKLTAFNTNGFSLGSELAVNGSGSTYVGWQWQAGQGSTSSNTSGSITSTVSVNTTAGFSIVTWTGNGTIGATVGHGLGVAPSMIIVKQRSGTESWATYHISLGATQYLNLNQTMAAATSITRWNNTTPSSTVITFYNDAVSNGSGSTYVAYCWAEIAGFSKFTSYTGNGSTDGPFVFCNFSPKWIMFKRTDSATNANWMILDTSRDTYNVADKALFANLSNAELTSYPVDILSNGFKIRGTTGETNASGGTYIVMAFASNPFKSSNAR